MLIALFSVSSSAFAQDEPAPAQRSTSIAEARFDVVQSPLAQSFTFRLDRFTGRVWQLTSVRGGLWEWEETPVPEPVPVTTPNRPRFQLHVSGISLSQTLLIDTETGKSWQFTKESPTYQRERSRNGYGWEVLPDR
jgi:hypothetical protein